MNRKLLGPFCRVFRLPATDPGMTQESKCVCSKVFCWRCYKPQCLPYLLNTDCWRLQGSVLKVPAQLAILAHSWRFKLTRCWAEEDQGLCARITIIRNTGKYFTLILSKFLTWRNFKAFCFEKWNNTFHLNFRISCSLGQELCLVVIIGIFFW